MLAGAARSGATTRSPWPRRWPAQPEAIVLSPGPCTPNEAGICLDLIAAAAGKHPDPRRLPRPPGDRPGVRRRCGARAGADARQDQPRSSTPAPTSSQAADAVRRHALPQPDRRPRHPAGGAGADRLDRGRPDHGHAPPLAADVRRAVPPREHRQRARPRTAGEFPGDRARHERSGPRAPEPTQACPTISSPSWPALPPAIR